MRAGRVRDDHAGPERAGLAEVRDQRRERVVRDREDDQVGVAYDVFGAPVAACRGGRSAIRAAAASERPDWRR